jgi:Fe-S cluster biosynthesis and repair protein YggX
LVVVRGGLGNRGALFDTLTIDEHFMMNFAFREIAFQHNDKITRDTRSLTKQALLFDVDGMKFTDMMDSRGKKIFPEISKKTALYYPQLQDKMIMCNCPSWMSVVMALMKKILPKRNIEKFELFSTVEDLKASEWAKKNIRWDRMPAFLGGEVLESDLDPDLRGDELDKSDGSYLSSIKIPARGVKSIKLEIPTGGVEIHWTLSQPKHNISLEVRLHHVTDADDVPMIKKAKADSYTILSGKAIHETGTEKGVWVCERPGVMEVIFDNSHSLMRSKTIGYVFDIVTQEGTEDLKQ